MPYLLILLLITCTTPLMAQNYGDAYLRLDRLTEEGKYRSALELADSIYLQAAAAGREDELLKALSYRVDFTRQLNEDGQQAALDLLSSQLAEQADRPVASALINILIGELYHGYAEQNSYRLRNSTEVAGDQIGDSTALADYSMGQLLQASREHLYRGLQLARENRTALGEIPALIDGGKSRLAEVPTLYDLLVQRAMEVLGSTLGSVTDELPADAETLLTPAPDYCNLDLSERFDTTKGTPRKLLLYQEWIGFHLDEGGPALLYADLERMKFVHRSGAADTSYLQALERMYERYAGNDLRDRILVEMASVLDRDDDRLGSLPRARALELLQRVGETDEVARVMAEQLRTAITAPALSARVSQYYPREQDLLVSLTYRNIERVYYRVYPYDPTEDSREAYRAAEVLRQAMSGDPVASGDQLLAENDDYGQHLTELALDALPAGGYRLVVSDDGDFLAGRSTFSVVSFQVSDLSVLKVAGEDEFVQVADRTTGVALADVGVEILREQRQAGYRLVATRSSDAAGTFTLPPSDRYSNYRLVLTDADTKDRLVTNLSQYDYERADDRYESTYVTLLTDRPIYRPGQTVHVYGLAYRLAADDLPSIVPGSEHTLILRDANYQEVTQQVVTADEYGRFNLDFTLPGGGLTGNFTIEADGGSVSLQVEEYKRPRFEASLEAPEAAMPGETVTVTGEALTYAGPAVAQASVSYRVYVEEQRWSFYYSRGGGGGTRELLHSGTTETADDGSFSFDFTTSTNLNTSGYRRYRYVVEADVADQTGETHEATASFGVRGERPAVALEAEDRLDVGDSLTIRALSDRQDTSLTIALRITPVTKPNASLLSREWGVPDRPVIDSATFVQKFPYLPYGPVPDLAEWPATGDVVFTSTVVLTQGRGRVSLPVDFPVGHYRIDFTFPDGTAGEPVTFSVYNSATAELPTGVLYQLDQTVDTVRVGEPVTLRLISAVDLPLVFANWRSRRGNEFVRESATRSYSFTYVPTEADRGGLHFALAFVRFNTVAQESRQLALPWDNKTLTATYATFRDKLRPGQPEQWTVSLKTADGSPVGAAALATMYDASLDQLYRGGVWQFSPYPTFYGSMLPVNGGSFGTDGGRAYSPNGTETDTLPELPYLHLGYTDEPLETRLAGKAYGVAVRGRTTMRSSAVQDEAIESDALSFDEAQSIVPASAPVPVPPELDRVDPAPVQLRTNLRETAFWLPELTADADGALQISFTSPEALTTWKFRLFAHDKALNYVLSEQEVVTQKELMVLPNVPRFVREGDQIELTTRVANLTDRPMTVTVALELFDPTTDQLLDTATLQAFTGAGAAGAKSISQAATLSGNGSETLRFPLSIPEGASLTGPLGYRVIARSDDFSDGEQNVLPILSDRTLITVRQPFYLKRGDKKTLTLPGLANLNPLSHNTLTPLSYTLQATTNPAWLALKALPYLMESPHDCADQLANRYFANQLAYATVSTKPVLEKVFRQWQSDSTALLGELEKNQDLKTALLTETPWVREAQSEAAQRARIGDLFQLRRLAEEQQQALSKLAARQKSDGAYSWFPGGRSDRYMTQYVVEILARMHQLDVISDGQQQTVDRITSQAIRYLDEQLAEDYRRLFAETKDSVEVLQQYRPSALQVHYLYARAMSGAPAFEDTKILDFYRERASASWTAYGLYEQALIALASHATTSSRGTNADLAETIIESLRERALRSDEFGMYWKYDPGYRWNNLPLETHTRLLEAFQRIDPRQEELDELRLWLLSNKRTNAWPTTKATAAAVYALLNTGETYVVAENATPIRASWPGASTKAYSTRVSALQETAEAATGAFTLHLTEDEMSKDLATVELKNPGNDLVWGGIYWQYTELASKVEASNEGPLSLERTLYKKVGDRLLPITEADPLHPGDRVTVRLTLRSDRDLDYVHLKDRRAATFEPVDALSTYRYQNGLGYYFAPGDLATNFFISDLPRGTYTLEYDLFTTYAGTFSSGLGRVECMYAPEFGGNSSGNSVFVD